MGETRGPSAEGAFAPVVDKLYTGEIITAEWDKRRGEWHAHVTIHNVPGGQYNTFSYSAERAISGLKSYVAHCNGLSPASPKQGEGPAWKAYQAAIAAAVKATMAALKASELVDSLRPAAEAETGTCLHDIAARHGL